MNIIANKLKKILMFFFGNKINFILGDSLVIDRLIWLKKYLPISKNNESLLDVGCGSGAFTIEASLMGYRSTGMSWDKANQEKAIERSKYLKVDNLCDFPICDARELDKLFEKEKFNFVINFENIEHILNDQKLFKDIYRVLKPGGLLLLTTPYFFYKPMSKSDLGPFIPIENGGHVRRGYTKTMLEELCNTTGFKIEKIDFCSGFFSQFTTRLYRLLQGLNFNAYIVWILIFPLRIFSYLFELLPKILKGNCYSICLVAYKPRG